MSRSITTLKPGTHRYQRRHEDQDGHNWVVRGLRRADKRHLRETIAEIMSSAPVIDLDSWDCPCGTPVPFVDGAYADGNGLYCDNSCFVEHGQMGQLTRLLENRDGTSGWDDEDPMVAWEYEVMGYEARCGVTHDEYLAEYRRRQADGPILRWDSDEPPAMTEWDDEPECGDPAEMDWDDYDPWYEQELIDWDDEDEFDEGDASAWLPVVPIYDPTGKSGREDAYSIFGGDGFIVEGASFGGRPEGTKTERDEWTVASLARAWDVDTSVMLDYLGDETLGNQAGLTPSSRVPMHVIAEQMERKTFIVTPQGTERSCMWVFGRMLLAHNPRKADAKQRRGQERHESNKRWLRDRWTEHAITDECAYGCKVMVNGLGQTKVVHYSGYGCDKGVTVSAQPVGANTMATPRGSRPYWGPRPGAPRPGNPFTTTGRR